MISFRIPGEAVGKGRPRMTRTGHAYTPEKTRAYEQHVKDSYLQAQKNLSPIESALRAEIRIVTVPPKSIGKSRLAKMLSGQILPTKKPDLDNIAKAVLDSLNGIAYLDDKQIVQLTINKQYGQQAYVDVDLTALD